MRLDDIDLTDQQRYRAGFPHQEFSRLRAEAPVWWHAPTRLTPNGEGFWVLTRYDDVQAAARDTATFSSVSGGTRQHGGTILPDLPYGAAAGVFMNMMDDPRHQAIRRVVAPAVSPRALARLESELATFVDELVTELVDGVACDFYADFAARLPMQVVGLLLDLPREDSARLVEWGNAGLHADTDDPEALTRVQSANDQLQAYGLQLIADRKAHPGTDMLSALATAEIADDGAGSTKVSDLELQMFFNLLIAAGTETTKGSLTGGLVTLIEHPEQMKALRDDSDLTASAIEEILRWTSVTPYNRRTATRDVELHGQRIRAGDKVTLWWASANRDERQFTDPFRFDIRRDPNRHLAFGHGTHFCLGANVARLEMRLVFTALLDRFEAFELTEPIEWQPSNSHTTVRRLPLAYRRRG